MLKTIATCFLLLAITSQAHANDVIQPADFFPDFPKLKFGMSVAETRKAVEATGARAASPVNTQVVWEAVFDKMTGRATAVFTEEKGLFQIAVVVYAMEKRNEVFEQWSRRIIEKHGKVTSESITEDVTSRLWDIDGVLLELRLIKDVNSPVIDIRWVKERQE
jgi:hypothetical protein